MATQAYTKKKESPLSRKGDRSATMVLTRLQGRTRRERTLVAFLVVIVDTTTGRGKRPYKRQEKGQENSTEENRIGGWIGQEGERRKSYSVAVIHGIKRKSRILVGDSIGRKTDSRLNKGEDVVVSLLGARIQHVTERVEQVMGTDKGGSILVHIGTNNADREGTTAIVKTYRNLLKKTKQARVG